MQIGTAKQSVEVSAGGVQLLETQTSSAGQVIESQPIVGLPLNGRNFMQLAVLSAAVAPPAVGYFSSPAAYFTGTQPGQVTVIAVGLRESNVSYLVNGIETRQAKFGTVGIRPSIDAIQEFKMQTSNFSAEVGRSSAVVNISLKSGTNSLHGTAFEFLRNNSLDANNFFLNLAGAPIPPYQQNDFGISLGGPLVFPRIYNGRNKTFFFVNYEGFRSRKGLSGTALVPSPAQLAGNLADDSGGTGIFPTNSSFCLANPASSKCLDVINPATGQPFAGNVIPSNKLDPIAQKWIPFIPVPNVAIQAGQVVIPSFNYTASPKEQNDFSQFNTRVDHAIGSKDQIFGSFSYDDRPHNTPSVMPFQGLETPLRDLLLAVGETHIFSPNIVNELRFGYNRSRTDLYSQGANGTTDFARTVFGLKNTSPNPVDFGVPEAFIGGFAGLGSGFTNPNASTDQDYQWVDNLSIVHGRHHLTMGINYIHEKYFSLTDVNGIPYVGFDGPYSHASLADFLLGDVTQATASVGDGSQNLRQNYYAGFLQDDWRLRPNFTINLGLRYEYFQTPYDISSKTAFFDPGVRDVVYSRDGGVRNGIVDPDWNNFGPRVGFAYSPGFLRNTVFRGSFGIFYATDNWNELQFENLAPRFLSSQTLNGDPVTPSLFLSDLFPVGQLGGGTLTPFSLDKRNRTPYVQEWAFDVQHSFAKDWLLDLGYMGNTGQKLYQRRDLNVPTPDPTGTIPIEDRRPYPDFGQILLAYNGGWSSYNALTLRAEKRISGGLYFLGSYTYSHALDLGYTDDVSASSCCFKMLDKGNSNNDVRHRVVLSYLWELPFGRNQRFLSSAPGALGRFVGGWKVNGITTFSTGQYQTAAFLFDWPNLGYWNSRPDRVGNPIPSNQYYDNWLNINAYVVPGCPTSDPCTPGNHVQGNAGRNNLLMPGLNNWDIALMKDTKVNERFMIEFRSEFFNAWNHTQFGPAFNWLVPGEFGRITSLRVDPREIQFGLKLVW